MEPQAATKPAGRRGGLVLFGEEKRTFHFPDPQRAPLFIGRAPDSFIRLAGNGISRRHCQLEPADGGWALLDLNSRNGTFVNKRPVLRKTLEDGDLIRVGPSALRYLELAPGPQPRLVLEARERCGREGRRYCAECDRKLPGEETAAAGGLLPLCPACWRRDPLAEREIRGFKILGKLQTGLQDDLYQAQQLSMGRTVVLRVCRPGSGREIANAYFAQARLAGKLVHPGILQIYDCGTEKNVPFVALEQVSGLPLDARRARSGPLPWTRLLPLALGAVSALRYAYRLGLLHGHLAPANLVCGEGDRLKILGFGLAGRREPAYSVDGASLGGQEDYRAPEVLAGGEPTVRSDIYSLGMILQFAGGGETDEAGSEFRRLAEQLRAPDPAARPADYDQLHDRLQAMEKERRRSADAG